MVQVVARDEDGAALVLVMVLVLVLVLVLVPAEQAQNLAHFLLDWCFGERSTVRQSTNQLCAVALGRVAVRKRCWTTESALDSGVDSGLETAGEWTNFVLRLKHQLASIGEVSDALGEDPGHQQLEEDVVLAVLDKVEDLELGLAD